MASLTRTPTGRFSARKLGLYWAFAVRLDDGSRDAPHAGGRAAHVAHLLRSHAPILACDADAETTSFAPSDLATIEAWIEGGALDD